MSGGLSIPVPTKLSQLSESNVILAAAGFLLVGLGRRAARSSARRRGEQQSSEEGGKGRRCLPKSKGGRWPYTRDLTATRDQGADGISNHLPSPPVVRHHAPLATWPGLGTRCSPPRARTRAQYLPGARSRPIHHAGARAEAARRRRRGHHHRELPPQCLPPAPSLRTVDAEGAVTSVSRPLTRRRGGRVGCHEMTAGADVRLVE